MAAVFVLCALSFGPALAQETPGSVGSTLQKKPELKQPSPSTEVTQPPRRRLPVPAGGARITVRHIEFKGNTVFSSQTLESLVAAYLNHPITLLDLYEAADKVTDFYARHGYSLASVTVPAQNVTSGTVGLRVFEGRVGKIEVKGNHRYSPDHVVRYLRPVGAGSIYRSNDLEPGMLRLNALPGLRAKAVVTPGSRFGTSDIVVKLREHLFSGSVYVDNYGRKDIGEIRYAGTLAVNNPLGAEDQLQLTALRSEGGLLSYGFVQYSRALNYKGLRVTGSFGDAEFRVAGKFAGTSGYNRSGRLTFDDTLIRSRNNVLSLSAGASATKANADLAGVTLSESSVALFELSGFFNHVYPDLAVTQVTGGISTNFQRATRAALTKSGQGAHQRLKMELDVEHLQPLFGRLQGFVRVGGVWSPDPLVDTQEYSLGGPYSVRGYPASEIRGDRGVMSTVELRYPFIVGPVTIASRAYYDSGIVYLVDPPTGTRGHDELESPGIGADILFLGHFDLKLDLAFPTSSHKASDGRNDTRLFASFTAGL